MTKEEIMMKHCSDNGLLSMRLGKSILAAMEEYAEQQLKNCNLQNVSGSASDEHNPFDLPDYCKKRGGCNHSKRICYDPTMYCYLDSRNGDSHYR